jgi:hypothetical protein
MTFVCPNGHPFPDLVAVRCEHCRAEVTCEPMARGMKFDRQLLAAMEALEWIERFTLDRGHVEPALRHIHRRARRGLGKS